MENIEIKTKNGLVWLIKQYQLWVSAACLPKCRFYPSCSNYAIESIRGNSFFYAVFLIIKRLLKCRPGGEYGIDYPPSTVKRGKLCNKNHG